jgi:pyocin large subunit-like protein
MLQSRPVQTPQSLELQREKSIGRYDSAVADTLAAESTASIPASESWANPSTLADHFARHGADFGATSAEDYASQASQFLQRAQQEGLPTKIDSNGIIRVYDPETNTFGSYNPNGTTRTFYKPPAGINYWSRQPGVAPTIVGGQ